MEIEDIFDDERTCGYVLVNGERVRTDEVEFLDISEDMFGRDEMTFRYNGKVYTSLVFVR